MIKYPPATQIEKEQMFPFRIRLTFFFPFTPSYPVFKVIPELRCSWFEDAGSGFEDAGADANLVLTTTEYAHLSISADKKLRASHEQEGCV